MVSHGRVAFVWDWPVAGEDLVTWCDGLHGALAHLRQRGYDIRVFTTGEPQQILANGLPCFVYPTYSMLMDELQLANMSSDPYRAILCWGSLDRPAWPLLAQYRIPMALCFAGGPWTLPTRELFQQIFVETRWFQQRFQETGYSRVTQAFGVDLSYFYPAQSSWYQRSLGRVLYVGSLAVHKRVNLLPGDTVMVGRSTHDGTSVPARCDWWGRVPATLLQQFYTRSSCVVIPGGIWSGSERVVLESFACETPVIVCEDNARCAEFVAGSGYGLIVEPTEAAIREAVHRLSWERPETVRIRSWLISSQLTSFHYGNVLDAWIQHKGSNSHDDDVPTV